MAKSTPESVDEQGSADRLIERFLQNLERQETSPQTRRAYRLDLLHFANRFVQTEGEGFIPEAITPTDVREYRATF